MSLVVYENSDSDEETVQNNSLITLSDNSGLEETRTSNKDTKEARDFFSLDSSNSSSDDDADAHVTNVYSINDDRVLQPAIKPHGKFWADESTDDWAHPENIWPTTKSEDTLISNNSQSLKTTLRKTKYDNRIVEYSEGSNIFENKRMKYTHNQVEQQSNPAVTVQQNIPIYFIHHKIAPLVNQSVSPCHIPKTCYIDLDTAHVAAVNRVQWCSGQYSHLIASASMDRSVKVWNVFSKQQLLVRTFDQHEKAVRDVCWSVDSRELLTGSYDKTARVFDVDTGQEKQCVVHPNFVTCARYHPSNPHIVITGSINVLYCWDIRDTKRPVRQYRHKDSFGQVNDLVFTRHGMEFFSTADLATRDSADRNIMAWDFTTGAVLSNQIYHERFTCPRLRIHPDGSEFFAQSQGNYIAAFSTIRPYKMNKCKRYESHKVDGYPVGFDVSTDGKMLISGSADSRLVVYDRQLARTVKQLSFPKTVTCTDVAWHPLLSSTVAAATWAGAIVIWQ